jgi:hypothetical protein
MRSLAGKAKRKSGAKGLKGFSVVAVGARTKKVRGARMR